MSARKDQGAASREEWVGFGVGFQPEGMRSPGDHALRHFERQEVFLARILEGEGVTENPFREVVYWLHPDGWVIHRYDAWEPRADA